LKGSSFLQRSENSNPVWVGQSINQDSHSIGMVLPATVQKPFFTKLVSMNVLVMVTSRTM